MLKRFEITILRPLYIIFSISNIIFLFKGMWLWLLSGIICLFFLGIIGSELHPLQSASDLAEGPLTSAAAKVEAYSLTEETKKILLSHACTGVGILIGTIIGLLTWFILSWQWYLSILTTWVTIILIGAMLKIIFKVIP